MSAEIVGEPIGQEIVFARASAYAEQARTIPYVLGLDGDPRKLLKEQKGNCTRKHLYLASKLIPMGYRVSLGFAAFDWRGLPIPRSITSILKDPTDTHMFLYVSIFGKGSVVDISWDQKMPFGFEKNFWDGQSSTPLGVHPYKIWRSDIDSFRLKALLGRTKVLAGEMIFGKDATPFNDAFNKWLGRSAR